MEPDMMAALTIGTARGVFLAWAMVVSARAAWRRFTRPQSSAANALLAFGYAWIAGMVGVFVFGGLF